MPAGTTGRRSVWRRAGPATARTLSAEDLSQPGWRFYTDAPDKSVAVVGGTAIPCREITGVLIRRPYIIEAELAHIHSADRHYVAAEMSAFLFAWLVSLTCPMLNRPRDFYLLGPPWRQEQWMRAAAALGIALAPIRRMMPVNTKDFSAAGEPVQVIVVAGHCFGVDAARFAPEAASVAAFCASIRSSAERDLRKQRRRFYWRNSETTNFRTPLCARPAVRDYLHQQWSAHSCRTAMIVLWGVATDGPLAAVRKAVDRQQSAHVFLDQWALDETKIEVWPDHPPRCARCQRNRREPGPSERHLPSFRMRGKRFLLLAWLDRAALGTACARGAGYSLGLGGKLRAALVIQSPIGHGVKPFQALSALPD